MCNAEMLKAKPSEQAEVASSCFSDVADIVTGKTPKKSEAKFFGEDVPFITPAELNGADPVVDAKTYLTEAGASVVTRLPENAVLVSCIGSLGKVGIAGREVCTNQQINSLVFDETKVIPRYGFHYCRLLKPVLEAVSSSTTLSIVNKTRFSELRIPLPPLPEQRRIAAILDKADALRQKRREAIAKLDQLLQSVFLEMFGDPVTNPMGWPMVAFGDVTNSRLGKMLDKRTSQGAHMKPYLANFNVQWGRFELDDLRQMNFDSKDQTELALRYGDLLVCEGGQPGRCAIWKEQVKDCYYQKALHRVRCRDGQCTPEFLQWYMWFMSSRGGFRGVISIATIGHLTGVKLKRLQVPLPPFDLQQIFTRFYNRMEKQKEKYEVASAVGGRLFSSIQQRAFTGQL